MLRCNLRLRLFCGFNSEPVILRPYQQECLDSCLHALNSGSTRIGVSLPTGAGKTTVFISLLAQIPPATERPRATRSLILVNSVELAHQKYKATGRADVTVATIQTLKSPGRLEKFDPEYTKAVIVDEAHHSAAVTYRRILSQFHSKIQNPSTYQEEEENKEPLHDNQVPIFGFSATFSRHDGISLGSVFEQIVYHRDFLQMIKEDWLCNVKFTTVKAKLDLDSVGINSQTGDFLTRSLAEVINTDQINNLVVKSWLDRAAHRKSTLVFCVDVAHVHSLTHVYRSYGVDARYLFAGTPRKEREDLLNDFRNWPILTEGADVPNIDCVIVARPTRSRNVYAQMIGRGMRLSPKTEKIDCHVIDFVDSTSRVAGIISSPTLFGLDPNAVLVEGLSTKQAEELEAMAADISSLPDKAAEGPQAKSVTYIDYDDPFSFIHGPASSSHISQMSSNAWVSCGGDIYVLECLGKGFVRIDPVDETEDQPKHFTAYYTPAMDVRTAKGLGVSPFRRSRHRNGASDPATDGQRKFISSRWFKKGKEIDENDLTKVAALTKGQAGTIITRLRHGAAARHASAQRRATREAKIVQKERDRQNRTHVKVGSLQ
ncbi:P-loop containing nucleoside triphosphate hydrolase protein [Flagelloscypha sp. PMI_526]|nr:P-loop containing nucleoside triphosphate hydrolase protein [Flagelloscypha sp. PMI_526]